MTAGLAAIVALALPTAAGAVPLKDYSKNAATGDYTRAPGPTAQDLRDAASPLHANDYIPAKTPSAAVVTVDKSSGFEWGDAAIGVGVGLSLALIGLGGTMGVRRHRIASSTG
jgi:hypothetical protein